MDPVSSTSSCSSRKITAQCPFRAQFAKRLYTLFHGPKRSGRSRQGMPVFTRNRTASMNRRSPLVAFGPVRWRGRKARSRAHCASVNACRCTQIFDHIADPRTSSNWLIFLSERMIQVSDHLKLGTPPSATLSSAEASRADCAWLPPASHAEAASGAAMLRGPRRRRWHPGCKRDRP